MASGLGAKDFILRGKNRQKPSGLALFGKHKKVCTMGGYNYYIGFVFRVLGFDLGFPCLGFYLDCV